MIDYSREKYEARDTADRDYDTRLELLRWEDVKDEEDEDEEVYSRHDASDMWQPWD